jgi:outer membrane protein TolC
MKCHMLKIKTLLAYLVIISICHTGMIGQQVVNIRLHEVIKAAQEGSSSALLSETRLKNQYWRYVSFKSFFKPQLAVNGVIPSINRSISSIALPDGSEAFVNRSFMSNSVGVQMTQNIIQTGGSIFVSSDIERLDLFGSAIQPKRTSYLSTPVSIGFEQPLFGFNSFKWNMEIQNMQYARAAKLRIEENEMIAIETLNRFFDLYLTDLNLETTIDNQIYLDSLAKIAVNRFDLGRIGETEMLQVELSARNADASVARLQQERQDKNERLRNYLGIEDQVIFNLLPPEELLKYDVSYQDALQFALDHRSEIADYAIRLKQAKMELEQAKFANRPTIGLNGRFGLTQSAETLGGAFVGLRDQESVRLTFRIPIADWGRSKAQREIAKSDLELEELQLRQERVNFERELELTTNQLDLVRDQLELAKAAFDISFKRQDIAKKRYSLGKQDATNLNIAIQEYASAKQNYYTALWELWQTHYQIRILTLFDFQQNKKLGGQLDLDPSN